MPAERRQGFHEIPMRMSGAVRRLARRAAGLRAPALFAAVGLMSTAIDIATYVGLTRLLGVAPLLANAIAYVLGSANGYVVNGRYTFRQSGRALFSIRKVAAYSVTYGISLTASTVVMAILMKYIYDLEAKLITVFISFVINYWLTRNFVFLHSGQVPAARLDP
jgi:putative flippase GtrA